MYTTPRKIIISVISDLVTDQRVNRAATTLHNCGHKVILIGREMRKSLPIEKRPYQTKRFKLWFESGPLFYASYNLRLFIFLLVNKADIYLANDLDTLAANYLASKIKKTKLVYDSHEYFTEVPELIRRPFVRSVWKKIETWIFPRLKFVFTVNTSISKIYSGKYNVNVRVIRNLPVQTGLLEGSEERSKWNIPSDKKVFLFQGAGINVDRGAEEAIEAIKGVEGAVLLFIGAGDVIGKLKKMTGENIGRKIFFIPKQPMKDLLRFTRMADFGLTLDKDTNLNYRYSLPNKLFDYMQAGLPVLATNLPEVKNIIDTYDVGMIVNSTMPEDLKKAMKEMMSDESKIAKWKKNINIAAAELCWENEAKKLIEIFSDVETA